MEGETRLVAVDEAGRWGATTLPERLLLIDMETRTVAWDTPLEGAAWTALDLSTPGNLAAVGDESGRVFVVLSTTGDELFNFRPHSETVTALRFSPDGRMLATGSIAGAVRIWVLRNQSLRGELPAELGAVWQLEWDPALRGVYFLKDDRALHAMPFETFMAEPIARLEPGDAMTFASEAGSASLLLLDRGGAVRFAEGETLLEGGACKAAALLRQSASSRWLAVVCDDGPLRVWDRTARHVYTADRKVRDLRFVDERGNRLELVPGGLNWAPGPIDSGEAAEVDAARQRKAPPPVEAEAP
ncbi:MAG: WD40 repeat domain-containing protein [Candidatus Sumerlaeia bacterium]|nr:WD40 repeat domain-containing protein [Candidatus Sumerlaeia bacterium]